MVALLLYMDYNWLILGDELMKYTYNTVSEKKKTLYISDLDGTLLNQSAELSAETTNALNTMIATGLNFSIATARSPATTAKILADLTLRIPIILMNGVLIQDTAENRYVKINKLPPDIVAKVINVLQSFDITGFMYELKDGVLMTYYESLEQKPLSDFMKERVARYNKVFQHTKGFDRISREHIIYFSLLDLPERLKPVHEALVSQSGLDMALYKDTYSPDLWYLEMFSAEASKRNAVDYLRETYGFDKIVGFGDNLNDLPMFEACDVKVAVENAKQEVKDAADYICGDNEGNGVVKWLRFGVRLDGG